MQNIFKQLTDLLKKDERLISHDNIVLKNKTQELAYKNDSGLIKLLLSDKSIKHHFFFEVEKTLIFDKEKFIRFISNKQFLPDSYTAFKNKIGLTAGDEYVNENKEVVLAWPYKDCVLEGEMTKENQKRDEIFYNETLASDDIDRLLDAKVFINFKRIDKKGEQKLDGFNRNEKGTIKDNLIIKGNNLLALNSLKKEFVGKVKLIYIDPPYNTGGNANIFTYNNSFNHSSWLTFMKNRLDIAKQLLKPEGFIAITIDHNELIYLGELADEVFGRENRLGIISIVIKPEGRQFSKFFSVSNEFMLVYARDITRASFENVVLDEKIKDKFDRIDEKGNYKLRRYINYNNIEISGRKINPEGWYPFYVSKNLEIISLEKKPGFIEIFPIDGGIEKSWQTNKKTAQERINNEDIICEKNKNNEFEIYFKAREGQRYLTHWFDSRYNATHQGTKLLEKIIGEKGFSYPKSLYAVLDTLKIMSGKEDLILDFFAGSGTTGHAVLELNKEDGGNRNFILIEQLDEHIQICTKRIKNIGGNFLYMELAKWNEAWIEKIHDAKTGKELAKLWDEMKETAFLSYKVDPKAIDANAKDFADLSLTDQKKFLIECLDKNQLYVNLSEIEDKEYGISKENKDLNKKFYGSK